MTPIQTLALPKALSGRDVLGAARTGSGKTLSFLIPVLERLYRLKWGPADGLGALIISPTRELAMQIFDVLRSIGGAHTFSAGLIIGGKDVATEKARLSRMNILVATPGRLLQHMDETLGFDAGNVQLLVLDEADRILDMGFQNTLDAVVQNVPKSRQTLLFSATQTKRVKDLARLSLVEPEYVAVRDKEGEQEGAVPKSLSQHYMVVPLEKKLDVLYSFVRMHLKNKTLVFLSSCRQVQFVHETFCRLRPGLSVLCLHGKQKQAKRLQIFTEFSRAQHAVLLATDIAARGLDFPAVDWVLQIDAPEDADTYVHRVGRTARYQSKGNSLLFLLPSEEQGALAALEKKRIAPEKIKARESKTQSIANQLQSFLFQDPELKYLGQKAFVSYVRSVHLQRDKATFDVTALALDKFAGALGLPGAPKVKFVREAQAAKKKAAKLEAKAAKQAAIDGDDDAAADPAKVRTKYDRMFERRNQGVLSEHYAKLVQDEDDSASSGEGEASGSEDEEDSDAESSVASAAQDELVGGNGDDELLGGAADDDGDFITLKRADHALESDDEAPSTHLSKRALAMGTSKKAMAAAGKRGQGEKVIFDEEGRAHALYELQDELAFRKDGDAKSLAQRFIEEEGARLKEKDAEDKERVRARKRERRRLLREREREERGDEPKGGAGVELAPLEDDDGYETPDFVLPGDSGAEDGSESDEATSEDSEAEEEASRPAKKRRAAKPAGGDLESDEALALRLLGDA
jgi:ATP-dependent RNA helicase DDX10/DBP4